MKKLTLVIVFVLTSIISNQVNAQNDATASAVASVTLVTPISITKTTDLSFGTFVASDVSGNVTMTPTGTVSASGGVTQISGGEISAASFTVSGESGQSYNITLPTADVILTGTNQAGNLTLNTFTSNPTDTGVIGTDGIISVGGMLTVPANAQSDEYTGTFEVSVNYN